MGFSVRITRITKGEKMMENRTYCNNDNFKNHIATIEDYGKIKVLDFRNPKTSEYCIRFLFDESNYTLTITGDLGMLVAQNYCNMAFDKFYRDYAGCENSGYFKEKVCCMSRHSYRYDEDQAVRELVNLIMPNSTLEDIIDIGEDEWYDFESMLEKLQDQIDEPIDEVFELPGISEERKSEIKEETDELKRKMIEEFLDGEVFGYNNWENEFFDEDSGLTSKAIKFLIDKFGDYGIDEESYLYDVGKISTGILELYLYAYKLAYEQLQNK